MASSIRKQKQAYKAKQKGWFRMKVQITKNMRNTPAGTICEVLQTYVNQLLLQGNNTIFWIDSADTKNAD